MARPQRNKLKFDENSAMKVLQEAYNECYNTRAKITRVWTKWEKAAKDDVQIATIGANLVKLLEQEGKNQDRKIAILRLMKEVVFEKNKTAALEDPNKNNAKVSSSRREEIIKQVQEISKNSY